MRASKSPPGEPVTYFAYLEEPAHRLRGGDIEGPDGAPLRERPQILSRDCFRARFSGIRAADFARMLELVERLPSGDLADAQRERRRAQLGRAFEQFPVPVIDLIWAAPDAAGRQRWRGRPLRHSPGRWFELRAARGEAASASRPVLIGEPEDGRPIDDFAAGQLVSIRLASPALTEALRDIFSLAHIGDADFGEEPEEPGAAPPDDGGGPPGVEVALVREDEVVVEAQTETERFLTPLRGRGDEGPQYVTVSEG